MIQKQQSSRSTLSHCMGIITLASLSTLAAAVEVVETDFHGYARSGIGSTLGGGDQLCFKAAGAPSKYRLGNECESYYKSTMGANFSDPASEAKFRFESTLSYKTMQDKSSENPATGGPLTAYLDPVSGDATGVISAKQPYSDLSLKQLFGQGSNVLSFMPDATFWAGKREYQKHSVDMIDFSYWDVSGPGFGIENIALGPISMDFAWMRNWTDVSYVTPAPGRASGKLPIWTDIYDVRVNDIKLMDMLTLEFGFDFGMASIGSETNPPVKSDYFGNSGYMFTMELRTDILGGHNTLAVQYAADAMTGPGLGHAGKTDQTSNLFAGTTLMRLMDHGIHAVGPLEFSYVLGYTQLGLKDTPAQAQGLFTSQDWITAGVRPMFKWSETTSTVAEFGIDMVTSGIKSVLDPQLKKTQLLYSDSQLIKMTLAQQFHPKFGMDVRPAIRLFATYAMWNAAECLKGDASCEAHPSSCGLSFADTSTRPQQFRDSIAKDVTSGITYGAQFEVSW